MVLRALTRPFPIESKSSCEAGPSRVNFSKSPTISWFKKGLHDSPKSGLLCVFVWSGDRINRFENSLGKDAIFFLFLLGEGMYRGLKRLMVGIDAKTWVSIMNVCKR